MTTIKQVCLGIAVAGVVAGTGSAVATAVASADSGSPGGQGSAKSSNSTSSGSTARSRRPAVKSGGLATGPRRTVIKGAPSAAATGTPAPAATVSARTVRRTITPMKLAAALPLPAPIPAPPLPLAPAGSGATGYSYRARSASATVVTVTNDAADPTDVHVLVLGVDGTNLRRVLAQPDINVNFIDLMNDSVTGVASIVGHTTISNPSWTAILTGAWDNQTGVINNIFSADTYVKWPTVFNQLEYYDSDIDTMAIADWDVITDIAGAGLYPADTVTLVPQVAGDSNWSQTDAEVTAQTVAAIESGDPPNFLFSYLVQVDEAGHQYGGASPQYAEAINRTDTNIGAIMDAVMNSGENWTVIVVTDHGHQPQLGFGHGFQSPDETATWVIAYGAGFDPGQMNLSYSIVDVTPTVMDLFGGPPPAGSDGVSLTTLGSSQVDPADLQQALQDAIAMNGWPDIATNVALSVRTIFASIPYFLDGGISSLTATLQDIAEANIFLISQLAAVSEVVVQVAGDALVSATGVVAELVAWMTGVDIFSPGHPLPPPPVATEPSRLAV
ncbi:alkaline phosphatase family protein [Mycobacterium sp. CVI_P3]|uniref:Alkaline phosphatase family protein n=1 Tax=Mycobacterium pinniadriaticum TaxID=2994102 RepID=A0ABT3SL73_9MYCO|nr:alkaline phosphatase family protein [Mycobacterium pinniadriaticum]MCX2933872.1 alkaline phosphatase family protein [Mycobacterium pinniadriaticum]MCX2940275.1 alkaline phosphatase family protein [Mycobacterium pinniadriaticum]